MLLLQSLVGILMNFTDFSRVRWDHLQDFSTVHLNIKCLHSLIKSIIRLLQLQENLLFITKTIIKLQIHPETLLFIKTSIINLCIEPEILIGSQTMMLAYLKDILGVFLLPSNQAMAKLSSNPGTLESKLYFCHILSLFM